VKIVTKLYPKAAFAGVLRYYCIGKGELMRDKRYLIWLSSLSGIGSKSCMSLVRYFGSAENVYNCSFSELRSSGIVGEKTAMTVYRDRNIENTDDYLKTMKESGINVYTIHESEYPENLKHIYDPPPIIYVKGGLVPGDNTAVGIVGARKATDYGLKAAQRIAFRLAEMGITVVSGMALGIDSAAHRGALKAGGRTIAVCACGLKHVYPASNYGLSQEISKSGALISEYPFDTAAFAKQFPARNRIISGMSLGVIVVEAGEKSGSLITADFALEQGREVFAVPGNISSPNSKGTNALIKNGAKLVSSIEDIIEELSLDIIYRGKRDAECDNAAVMDISIEEGLILKLLQEKEADRDEIADATKLQPGKVMSALTKLEIKGMIQQVGENYLLV